MEVIVIKYNGWKLIKSVLAGCIFAIKSYMKVISLCMYSQYVIYFKKILQRKYDTQQITNSYVDEHLIFSNFVYLPIAKVKFSLTILYI